VPCVRLTNDNDGQTLKTSGSKRLVPLHPDLIRLGLMHRVDALRAHGAERLFPEMRIDSNAGTGNALSKCFSYYIKMQGVKPRRKGGIVGFHSLRKTVIQTLQGSTLTAERRRALVGHEPEDTDVHAINYMRPWTAAELSMYFPSLPWGTWLDFEGLKELLQLPSINSGEKVG
jgi:integrase